MTKILLVGSDCAMVAAAMAAICEPLRDPQAVAMERLAEYAPKVPEPPLEWHECEYRNGYGETVNWKGYAVPSCIAHIRTPRRQPTRARSRGLTSKARRRGK